MTDKKCTEVINVGDIVLIDNGRYNRPIEVIEVYDDYVIVSKFSRVRISKSRLTKVQNTNKI